MPRFTVHYQIIAQGAVEVEAENEEEARAIYADKENLLREADYWEGEKILSVEEEEPGEEEPDW